MVTVEEGRHEDAVGFQFNKTKGGYLLILYTMDDKVLPKPARFQVGDLQEAKAVLDYNKCRSYLIFDEFELFGGPPTFRCICGKVSGARIMKMTATTVRGHYNTLLPTMDNVEFIVDTGASTTLLFVEESVYQNVLRSTKMHASDPKNAKKYTETSGTQVDGTEVKGINLPIVLKAEGNTLIAAAAFIVKYPSSQKAREGCANLLGMDIIGKCLLTFGGGHFTLESILP